MATSTEVASFLIILGPQTGPKCGGRMHSHNVQPLLYYEVVFALPLSIYDFLVPFVREDANKIAERFDSSPWEADYSCIPLLSIDIFYKTLYN